MRYDAGCRSILKFAVNVPPDANTEVTHGQFRRSLGPLSPSPASLAVTMSVSRLIPSSSLDQIWFCVIVTCEAPSTRTPSRSLKRMTLLRMVSPVDRKPAMLLTWMPWPVLP